MPPRSVPRLRLELARLAIVLTILLGGAASCLETGLAQEIVVGGTAAVASEGDGLLLRDGPGYDAGVIEVYPDATVVMIVDGPFAASDGSAWFAVEVAGQSGYMVSDWLVAASADPAPASGWYCDGAQEYIDQAALRADLMRIHAHDVMNFGGRMTPNMNLALARALFYGHEDQFSWGSAWPEWYWPTYEMMDAMKNAVEWEFATFPGTVAIPDRNNHPSGSRSAAQAWAAETEQRYLDASAWFIETCDLVWPQLPADPYDYIR